MRKSHLRRIGLLLLCAALCAMLAVSASAYPAGLDETLPRVVDNANLLTRDDAQNLEEKLHACAAEYRMDIVILLEQSIDGETPEAYADDYFDYQGYGWREEESDDITTGSGVLMLVAMESRDFWFSAKGRGEEFFPDGVLQNDFTDSVGDYLRMQDYEGACARFLEMVAEYLALPPASSDDYGGSEEPYGPENSVGIVVGNMQRNYAPYILVITFVAALTVAWLVVASMKRKLNTAHARHEAQNYMQPGTFRLTQQQDLFLYSNTTRIRRPDPVDTNSSGGHGFGGGGGHISSSGSHHSGGGGKF
ncbi:MAG: TPM domain-containing protein [Oscillospiraceae bacterium]|jgi:uncharacterized protein|nr:TPM domain-containing protein [Oscillospiraceae bacterium]